MSGNLKLCIIFVPNIIYASTKVFSQIQHKNVSHTDSGTAYPIIMGLFLVYKANWRGGFKHKLYRRHSCPLKIQL